MQITINGVTVRTGERFISYWEIVRRAGFDPRQVYTVTYHGAGMSGSITPTQAAEVVDGMNFTVVLTGEA